MRSPAKLSFTFTLYMCFRAELDIDDPAGYLRLWRRAQSEEELP
jgi:hypothetical protein